MTEFFIRLFAMLPLSGAQATGSLLGRLAWHLNGRERKNAEINIRLCFPDLQVPEQKELVRRTLRENGKLIAELPKSWLASGEYWRKRLEGQAFTDEIRRLLEQGRGVIIAAPHLGNWEVGLHSITAAGPTTVLYRPPRQAWLASVMDQGRIATGAKTAPTDMQGIRALMSALRNGEIVAILPDQVPKEMEQSSVTAPFFGHPAPTMTLISKLARKTGAPVVAAYAERLPRGKGFRVRFEAVDEAVSDASAEVSAAAVNHTVEALVRLSPHQYQWTYRRFGMAVYRR
jgi:KDO2-lipid IV(A) lauroyltransferase